MEMMETTHNSNQKWKIKKEILFFNDEDDDDTEVRRLLYWKEMRSL
jgi:hypothetical protein